MSPLASETPQLRATLDLVLVRKYTDTLGYVNNRRILTSSRELLSTIKRS